MIKNNKISSICIITQYYFPETGAPQIRLANMGRVLKSQNVDVSVITTFPSYPDGVLKKPYRRTLRQIETIDDIAITRVFSFIAAGKQKLRRVLSYVSFSFFAIPSVIFSKQPDIFFVEAQPVTLAIPAFLAKIFRGTPYVYNTPDLQVEHAKEDRWVPNFVVYFASHLEGFLMRNSLAVTTVTDSFRDYFVSKYKLKPNRVLMLPNGADTKRLKPIPFDENFYNQLNLGEKKLFFTFAGTHAHYQGLELIIEVANKISFRKDIGILMIGNGPVRDKLIDMAKQKKLDNIYFRQSATHEMSKLMSITYASLVVLRALPISKMMRLSKAIPPLACGVPVIYSGWGETPKIISNCFAGVSVEPEDVDLMSEAIINLADRPKQRLEMSKNARHLAVEEFDWSIIISNWLTKLCDVYEERYN